jgi:hypothetical protein
MNNFDEKTVDRLCARIVGLEAENAKLRQALEMVEWKPWCKVHGDGEDECLWCYGFRSEGHKPDCARQLALTPTGAGEGEAGR